MPADPGPSSGGRRRSTKHRKGEARNVAHMDLIRPMPSYLVDRIGGGKLGVRDKDISIFLADRYRRRHLRHGMAHSLGVATGLRVVGAGGDVFDVHKGQVRAKRRRAPSEGHLAVDEDVDRFVGGELQSISSKHARAAVEAPVE